MIKNLLVVTPSDTSHNAFLRTVLPMMEYTCLEVSNGIINWRTLMDKDAVLLEEPYTPEHLAVIRLAHRLGIRVWVDWSYDPFTLSEDDAFFKTLTHSPFTQALTDCLKEADVVTTSSAFRSFDVFNPNTLVVPAYLKENFQQRLLKDDKPREERYKSVFLWRSMKNNPAELWDFGSDISALLETETNTLICISPVIEQMWYLKKIGPNVKLFGPNEVTAYYEKLLEIKPDYIITTSQESSYPNFAHIDAALCGAKMFNLQTGYVDDPQPLIEEKGNPFYHFFEDFMEGKFDK